MGTVNFNAVNCTSMQTTYNANTYSVFSSNTSGAAPAITKVVIGSNVTRIPDYAFYNASNIINGLGICSSVTEIGNYAFYGCNSMPVMHIQEGSGLQSIGDYAFYNCSGLKPATTLTIPNSVTSIGQYAFYGCSQLPSVTIGESVATIGESAFRDCSGLSAALNIPNSVTSIGQYAFYGCSQLPSVTIGESVATIGGYAFWNCPALETVNFNAVNCTSMQTAYNKQTYSVFSSNTSGEASAITQVVIGSNVTRIPDYAFRNSPNVTENLLLPSGLNYIGNYAFHDCSGFTGSLVIPDSVTTIGSYAFRGCSGFNGSLTIGNSVTTIGERAFNYCSGFTGSLVIPNSVTIIGDGAFNHCSGFTGSLTIGNSVTTIGYGAFNGCSSFTGSLVIPNSVTTIGDSAFNGCSGFTGSLVIPDSVTTIGEAAFYGCNGFNGSLAIPNSVTTIGSYAFYQCSGFTGSLVIPNSVNTISFYAFYQCSSFTGSLVIPNSVTTIDNSAFNGCSGFTGSLTIGNSVTTIGYKAFQNCSGFTALIAERYQNPATANSDSFEGMNYNIPFYVPFNTKGKYQNATGWSNFTNRKEQYTFEEAYDNLWSGVENWYQGALPTASDVVCLVSNCHLDVDTANVLYVYIADNEKVLTVNDGKALTTTYGVHIENASKLVVEDGGQVKSGIPFSGTVQKDIAAYTSGNDGWNFIASPVTESLTASTVSGLIPSGGTVYDLYYLDEKHNYWRNYKNHAFKIKPKQGYLYANEAGTTISFSGTMQPYVAEGVSIPLTKEGKGWNLVGNPFPFNANANKSYYVINGRNVEARTSGAIAPCTGIVVKAEGTANETVKFTKAAPAASSAPSNGSLQVVLAEANTRGASRIDNAIVSFNEGTTLPKFRFGDNAQIYIPQNGEDYAITCAAKTGELPLNFKATKNGEYTLSVNPEDVEMEYLHLIDNMTGADIDLLQTPDYTFNAKTTDYASRFRLVFSTNSVSEDTDGDDAAFAYISNGEIVLTDATADATLQIVDVTGRVVVSVGGHTRCVPTAGMTPGVYVLRLINGNDVKTQKTVIR